jgi:hypothetical protein
MEVKSKPAGVAGQAIGSNAGSVQPTIFQSEFMIGTLLGHSEGLKQLTL